MNILIAGYPGKTKNYDIALAACGASFVSSLDPASIDEFDKLLLPGGVDIHPSLYHQNITACESIDTELDTRQFAILDAFVKAGKPILGICRGIQVLNVYFGGDLIQDLPTSAKHRRIQHDQTHKAINLEGSVLASLYGSQCTINSAHHQGCGTLARDFVCTQTAPDGTIEAIEHLTLPIIGVQWHPERTTGVYQKDGVVDGKEILQYFVNQLR